MGPLRRWDGMVPIMVGCGVPDLAFVGGRFISPACISAGDLDISGWWITGLWICAGAMNGAPTMGAYYIVPIMVGCSVPEHVLSIYGLGVDIFICIFNVGIYILENVGQIGLPIPEKMKGVFQQLREK